MCGVASMCVRSEEELVCSVWGRKGVCRLCRAVSITASSVQVVQNPEQVREKCPGCVNQ